MTQLLTAPQGDLINIFLFQERLNDIMRDYPHQQGLYNPQNEHDACGIGVVVNIKGNKSHDIVANSLKILVNLNHRGGSGSEKNSGDGAGILIQIPHDFLANECKSIGFELPQASDYGIAMAFLPPDEIQRSQIEEKFIKVVEEEGQQFIGIRTVPINPGMLGNSAFKSMPFIRQLFIGKNPSINDNMEFERKLYTIRKRMEAYSLSENKYLYVSSLSSGTIVYKGMLTADQVGEFFLDLTRPELTSAIALVHSRYSTNTFPSWERAHPNRYLIHNGEINTLRGNVNWMNARENVFVSELFAEDLNKVMPVINQDGSDSAMFDNALEFLHLAGRPLPHAMMMMIPEPWLNNNLMDEEVKNFYEYHSCIMEPWDGPSAMAFTDGKMVGAVLDRNGLRPSRYYVTSDDMLILASEVGVMDIPPEKIICKERLHPGRMLIVDTIQGRIINDEELKMTYASQHPYGEWIKENMIDISSLPLEVDKVQALDTKIVVQRQRAFGYTIEDLKLHLAPMAKDGVEAIGSMGIDSPIAVLSDKPQLLFNYFKQLFAQVTNPPIDALREELVTSAVTYLGTEGNILLTVPENCRQIRLTTPIIDNKDLTRLASLNQDGFRSAVFPMLFPISGEGSLSNALDELYINADKAIENGVNVLILSDRGINSDNAAIPSLLAVSGLHHHLIRSGVRTSVAIVLETAEPREVHHFALLLGYGASAINPYLAVETIVNMVDTNLITDIEAEKAIYNYLKSSLKGVIKVLSKMGISTIQSYQAAQIFEALGLSQEVVDRFFTSTPTRIGGLTIEDIQEETLQRHRSAYELRGNNLDTLESGGCYQWRKDGEYHLYNPETIYKLQKSVRNSDYNLFKEFSNLISGESAQKATIRGLLDFEYSTNPIPLDEVEPVESIVKRFKTGAMSYGSISLEAHEAMAIAMNRIGGKSNSGEGGEDPQRYIPMANGDSKSSAIKQVASGRFGVTSHYLVNAQELQIKMAQGAKPGEGGQLPGKKVYPWIAKVRHSTPGVGLISPPPHHDIYSIEDLAELIHDLKNANRAARISVKLVSEVGVGTVAAGVAKGRADVVLISGYDGGTGASPRTSIKHTGLPWELGLAETHQTLLLNDLRSRIVVEVDGKLMTGREVAIAALLGAEEFGFATAPLVSLGCVMMRVCNLDTCPVGVATQNPELRKNFTGKAEHVINFMNFIAMELREIMAKLGFRTMDEMIGKSEFLKVKENLDSWKLKNLDLSALLYKPQIGPNVGSICTKSQDHEIDQSLDVRELLSSCSKALENKEKVSVDLVVRNTNRVVGTVLGSEISKKHGAKGLPSDTITLNCSGSAGQSFGAFAPKGITLNLVGDCNDYIGKGLSGGKISVRVPAGTTFEPSANIIVGNVALYGATSGEAYISGMAGERFCVRNSGATAVVEGVGDHGCEYMTGGRVVVLGRVGKNFAAGMSGGIAYIIDQNNKFRSKCNTGMVELTTLENPEDILEVKTMIENHIKYTDSTKGKEILANFEVYLPKFVKILPTDYARMLNAIKEAEDSGLTGEEAQMAAFQKNNQDISRVSGS